MRQPIAADKNLAVTLRFLATGESYESLMYQFRIHRTTIGRFIPQVSRAIYAALKDEYLKVPSTEQEWEFIADETFKRWNFPNAFAAADGKHIALFHPVGSGSEYYNYKGFYSLVLLAFVDYDYKFLLIDVGCQGRISDGDVFSNSAKCLAIKNDLNLPEPRPLPYPDDENDMFCYDQTPVPFMFVADDAFPLTDRCMKPCSQRSLEDIKTIFGYRLSRFRRVSENGFGIWSNRFRLFLGRANILPETAVGAAVASLVLHNMLRTKSRDSYTPSDAFDEAIDSNSHTRISEGRWRI